MESHIVRTDAIYHEIINAPDVATRRQIYADKIVQAWKPMMQMVTGMGGAENPDEFAGARAWGWYLPEELDAVPEVLQKLEDAQAWDIMTDATHKALSALAPFAEKIPFERVEGWLVIGHPQPTDTAGYGYTGAIDFMNPRFICQYDTPTERNLRALAGCAVHELNHLVRLRAFPWDMRNTSVTDYIIHEGLAESFATELFGEEVVGFYVTDFEASELETAKALIHAGLDKTGFDLIRAYIFGDQMADTYNLPKIGMPAYGGYAIGYRVVQAYLKKTGCSAVEATFTPAKTIVQESGFFN